MVLGQVITEEHLPAALPWGSPFWGIADPVRTFPFPIYKYYDTIYISDNDLAA